MSGCTASFATSSTHQALLLRWSLIIVTGHFLSSAPALLILVIRLVLLVPVQLVRLPPRHAVPRLVLVWIDHILFLIFLILAS